MTEPARSEVDADPDGARFVHEDVDVVVAAADRAELLARLGLKRLAMLRRDGAPRRIVEEWMIHRRVVRLVLSADAEAHGVGDRVGDLAEQLLHLVGISAERFEGEVGADRRVSAGDVEPDAHDRDLVVVRRDAADRHDVAHVAVGHESGVDRVLTHMLELDDGLFVVLAEDLHSLLMSMISGVPFPVRCPRPAEEVLESIDHWCCR